MPRLGEPFSFFRRGAAPPDGSSGAGTGGLLVQLAVGGIIVLSALGTILAWRLTEEIGRSAIREAADDTQDTLAPLVARQLGEEDLTAPMTGQRYAEFQRFLEESVISEHTLRVKLWSRDGTVLYSDDPDEVGTSQPVESHLAAALAGGTAAQLGTVDSPELAGEGDVLEVYAPLVLPGSDQVVGALEIYENPTHLAEHLSVMRKYIVGGLGIGLAAYCVIVLLIVRRAVRAIRRQQEEIDTRARETVRAVVAALDLRDTESEHHAARVAEISLAVAHGLKLAPRERAELEVGALLHDVGKIGVPDHVLRKSGPLTAQEWEAMRHHPELGYQLLKKFPSLQAAARLVRGHHEHFDGSGYPRGLAGEAVPLPARIFAIADAYDAITSHRPYRAARTHEEALTEISRCAGSQFDPVAVRAFLAVADRFWRPAALVEPAEPPEQSTEDIVSSRAA